MLYIDVLTDKVYFNGKEISIEEAESIFAELGQLHC